MADDFPFTNRLFQKDVTNARMAISITTWTGVAWIEWIPRGEALDREYYLNNVKNFRNMMWKRKKQQLRSPG